MVDPTLYYSGGASNSNANASIGGDISTTAIPDNVLDNLFDKARRVEIIVGRIEARCFYVKSPDDKRNVVLRKTSLPANTDIWVGVEGADVAEILSSEDQIPGNVKFYKLNDFLKFDLPLGFIDTDKSKPIWIRRLVKLNSPAISTIGLEVEYEDTTIAPAEEFSDKGSFSESLDSEVWTGPFRMGTGIMGRGVIG